jgi:hypothetical protein
VIKISTERPRSIKRHRRCPTGGKELTPEQQLKVLSRIWRDQDGWIFLPVITGDARRDWRERPALKWPEDQEKILARLRFYPDDDLLFHPGRLQR